MAQVPVVRVTGRASRFLRLLQDFGHLDDEAVARIELGLGHEGPVPPTLDLDAARLASARALFEAHEGIIDGLLAEDWPILYS